MNKKGVVDELIPLVITLLMVGIIGVVGLLILGQTTDQVVSRGFVGGTVENESVAWTNLTYVSFATTNIMDASCSLVLNESVSGNTTLTTGNYSCNEKGIKVSDSDGDNLNASVYVTYTYKLRSSAYNGSVLTTDALDGIPAWFPIIVVAFIGALLIGLVQFFRNRQE